MFLRNERLLVVFLSSTIHTPPFLPRKILLLIFFCYPLFLSEYLHGECFEGMCLLQNTVSISVGITFITRMEKTTKILIHSVLFLRITVHRPTVFADFLFLGSGFWFLQKSQVYKKSNLTHLSIEIKGFCTDLHDAWETNKRKPFFEFSLSIEVWLLH